MSFRLNLGICIIDDDRIVSNYDMEFGFEVWQVRFDIILVLL